MKLRRLNHKTKLKIAAVIILTAIIGCGVALWVLFSFYRVMTETRVTLAVAGYARTKQVVSRGGARGQDAAGRDAPGAHEVIVAPGDTLWDIAGRYYPGVDARKVVWALKVANGLEDAGALVPGMRVALPKELK